MKARRRPIKDAAQPYEEAYIDYVRASIAYAHHPQAPPDIAKKIKDALHLIRLDLKAEGQARKSSKSQQSPKKSKSQPLARPV